MLVCGGGVGRHRGAACASPDFKGESQARAATPPFRSLTGRPRPSQPCILGGEDDGTGSIVPASVLGALT